MARQLLTDELWEDVRLFLPRRPSRPRGGRPPIDDRDVLTGILFVLKTGIPWEDLPHEMGCGCGMTCWRRLQEWHRAGIWPKIRQVLAARWRPADRVDWSRVDGGDGPFGPDPGSSRRLLSSGECLHDRPGGPGHRPPAERGLPPHASLDFGPRDVDEERRFQVGS